MGKPDSTHLLVKGILPIPPWFPRLDRFPDKEPEEYLSKKWQRRLLLADTLQLGLLRLARGYPEECRYGSTQGYISKTLYTSDTADQSGISSSDILRTYHQPFYYRRFRFEEGSSEIPPMFEFVTYGCYKNQNKHRIYLVSVDDLVARLDETTTVNLTSEVARKTAPRTLRSIRTDLAEKSTVLRIKDDHAYLAFCEGNLIELVGRDGAHIKALQTILQKLRQEEEEGSHNDHAQSRALRREIRDRTIELKRRDVLLINNPRVLHRTQSHPNMYIRNQVEHRLMDRRSTRGWWTRKRTLRAIYGSRLDPVHQKELED